MRKFQKQQISEIISSLWILQRESIEKLERKDYLTAQSGLSDCQEAAIQVGEAIEQIEGTGTEAVAYLEKYCEMLYQVSIQIESILPKEAEQRLNDILAVADQVIKEISVRQEVVFLPYKASMWDSLESVWIAADADPDCDAYVVPIPYYERNAERRLEIYCYEGGDFPDYVPITPYQSYSLQERHPDVIYIHNPYDNANYVTSIAPQYYSEQLKKYTDLLVYIPYYSTSGGMGEGQALCPAYLNVDYIVVQAEKYRKYFDPHIPREKLLAIGSPKFDRIIRMCQNPSKPPIEWQEKMQGKKVYFYNTSLNGMLADTEKFLQKMEYVFDCFRGRADVCLLWRPHPLMESTLDSMRKEYRSVYDNLKRQFCQEDWGIYDDTPDIEKTIALCDVYIGDAGTSVTSLFGMAGKPIFILNNNIHHSPQEDDWRGEIVTGFQWDDGYDEWKITQGNKLYHSADHNYQYVYYCDLSEYADGRYYRDVIEINGKIYACPVNAQDVLVMQNQKIIKKIDLKHELEGAGAFEIAWRINHYIFLIPNRYPAIVRLDTRNDKVSYISEGKDVFVKDMEGRRRIGGSCVWKQYLLVASPVDNQVLAIDSKSMKLQVLTTMAENACGCVWMVAADTEIWLLPYEGRTITRWNPETGEMREYSDFPENFRCQSRPYGYDCMEKPFCIAAQYKNNVLFPPWWGNMFLLLDKDTGEMKEWEMPFEVSYKEKNEYFFSWGVGYFLQRTDSLGEWTYRYYHTLDRKLYDINLETREFIEIPIEFNKKELEKHTAGFDRTSDWIMYSCMENAFNSLTDLLDDHISGKPFDRDRQVQAYKEIAANNDGTCGEKIHQFISKKWHQQEITQN